MQLYVPTLLVYKEQEEQGAMNKGKTDLSS